MRYRYRTDTTGIGPIPIPSTGIGLSLSVTVRTSETYDREVVGSTPGRVTIKWLVPGWVTDCGQVNHLGT